MCRCSHAPPPADAPGSTVAVITQTTTTVVCRHAGRKRGDVQGGEEWAGCSESRRVGQAR
eukprot:952273-Prymnesium_polylepis.1